MISQTYIYYLSNSSAPNSLGVLDVPAKGLFKVTRYVSHDTLACNLEATQEEESFESQLTNGSRIFIEHSNELQFKNSNTSNSFIKFDSTKVSIT